MEEEERELRSGREGTESCEGGYSSGQSTQNHLNRPKKGTEELGAVHEGLTAPAGLAMGAVSLLQTSAHGQHLPSGSRYGGKAPIPSPGAPQGVLGGTGPCHPSRPSPSPSWQHGEAALDVPGQR